MINAYAQSYASVATLCYESLQFAVRSAVVAGIYANFIHIASRNGCHLWHKVNVGNDSRRATIFA